MPTTIPVILSIIVYLLAIIAITYYSSKRETSADFIIASKKLGWKQVGFSTFATLISSFNIVIIITFAFLFGIYLILAMGGVVLAFIMVYHMEKKVRKSSIEKRFITVVDYFNFKYGKNVATIINLILLFVLLFFITLQINVNTLVFSNLLEWSKVSSAIFVALIVLFYSYVGGFKTIVKTDFFQGILMLFIIILAFLVGSSSITTDNVISNLSDATIFLGASAIMIAQFLTMIVQPELWQRVYSAKSLKDLRLGLMFASILLFLVVIPGIIIGMNAKFSGSITNVGNAFYEVLSLASPAWFFPIVAVALFAAFMSTLDSSLFALSSQLAKSGFVVGYKDEKDDKILMKKIRIWMVSILIVTLITSLFLSNFLASVFQLISIAMIISTAFILSLILKVSKKEMFIALIIGTIGFVFASLNGLITENPITSLYPAIFLVVYMVLQNLVFRMLRY
ncbi:MAG: sodium:solute symporter [Candidatus Nanoarchaeia archaeon]